MRHLILVITLIAVIMVAPGSEAAAQETYGKVDFATSCQADGAETFNEAVALVHHMMYEQAAALFQDVADADPHCAMAQWGLAMSQLHPLWAPPTDEEFAQGRAAVGRARALTTPTGREAAYVDAIAAFFETEGGFPTRLEAWDAAQSRVYEQNRGDVDAAAFHALARLATAPRDDDTFARQADVGSLLEELLESHPQHPGLFHYAIHAYDNPVLADRAVDEARDYDLIAPEVPHALHMPSHIFVRLGYWKNVISWNRRSAEAALKNPLGDLTSMHFPHAMDYLVYGNLQIGHDDEGVEAIRDLLSVDQYQPHLGTAYGLAAPPARLALERRDWAKAAALPVQQPESFPWSSFPAAESITWFAKGLGSALENDEAAARAAVEQLNGLHEALVEAGEAYWAVHTDAQRIAIGAWILFAEGRAEHALAEMRRAADLEDSVDKHPITPSSVLPMRELLGEMHLMMDNPDAALEAFESALAISPRRLNSLSGAARAAELLGHQQTAALYYGHVGELLEGQASIDRPRMAEVRAFLIGE